MEYRFFDTLFLRAPFYSYLRYDPARLPEVLQDAAFRRAVQLASPGLTSALEALAFDFARLSEKQRHTLLKYYNRMCFRPTPFGSFATFTLLSWPSAGETRLAGDEKVVLHRLPEQRAELLERTADMLWANPLLYRFGKGHRLVQSLPDEAGKYRFTLAGIDDDPFYRALFRFLKSRTVPAQELRSWLANYAPCSPAEADEQLAALLENQVLLSGHSASPISLPGPPASVGADEKRCYAAAERPVLDGGPSAQDQLELAAAVNLLQRMALTKPHAALENFCKAFQKRFERQKVPLLLATDPDAGIAYDNSAQAWEGGFLLDLPLPVQPEDKDMAWTPLHRLLLRRWINNDRRGPYDPVVITAENLDDGFAAAGPFPPTTSLMYRRAGDDLLLELAGGASATALAGRFSLFSPEAAAYCKQAAEAEMAANPGVVFADIGQLSGLHTDNINRRQRIYPYEIPLNVLSALPGPDIIRPEDLLVSLRGNELVLESLRLGKRVIPRLATAYHYRHNELGVFRLLCDLQYQGLTSRLGIDPEGLFPGLSFYPRIYCGKVIVSLAKWHLSAAEVGELHGPAGAEVLQELRRYRGLPPYVSMGMKDQQLVFDLSDPQERRFFLACLRGHRTAVLQEYLLPGRSVKSGPEPFAAQYIAGLYHDREIYPPLKEERPATSRKKRAFIPGSEWLYLKLYCTPVSSGKLLAEVLAPTVRRKDRCFREWFFVRYTEEGYHLRLRFRTDDPGKLLQRISRRLRQSGQDHLLHDFTGGTYQRELERYPGEVIEAAELLFMSGSNLALAHACDTENALPACSEFDLGIRSAYRMITGFLPGESDVLAFCAGLASAFLSEFQADKASRLALDAQYRALREELPRPGHGWGPYMGEIGALAGRLGTIKLLTASWTKARQWELLADLVHMQLNRNFRAEQRKQELFVYYCLEKHLRSLKARNIPFTDPAY
jgi:thiopeptide-type bacteriocin biosynthesis protein